MSFSTLLAKLPRPRPLFAKRRVLVGAAFAIGAAAESGAAPKLPPLPAIETPATAQEEDSLPVLATGHVNVDDVDPEKPPEVHFEKPIKRDAEIIVRGAVLDPVLFQKEKLVTVDFILDQGWRQVTMQSRSGKAKMGEDGYLHYSVKLKSPNFGSDMTLRVYYTPQKQIDEWRAGGADPTPVIIGQGLITVK